MTLETIIGAVVILAMLITIGLGLRHDLKANK